MALSIPKNISKEFQQAALDMVGGVMMRMAIGGTWQQAWSDVKAEIRALARQAGDSPAKRTAAIQFIKNNWNVSTSTAAFLVEVGVQLVNLVLPATVATMTEEKTEESTPPAETTPKKKK